MSQWAGGVLTAAGRVLQAKVEAGTTALILTKIKLGDGTEGMDTVDNLTDLVGPKAVLGISSSVADGDHATITGVVLSTQLQAGFWCREWGLFARDPDAGEILYMVTIDAQPEWLPASTAAAQVSATYAMNIAVANATNIEVQIDPAGLVDVEMLQSYMGLAKRSTAVALGDTAMLENLPAMYFLECTTAGTTGATAPVITPPVSAGQTISDGTVVWTVRKCFPTSGGALLGDIHTLTDNIRLKLMGGSTETTGAELFLSGVDYNNPNLPAGSFILQSCDGVNFPYLRGTPDGKLIWAGNSLDWSTVTAIDNGVNGYVKFKNGIMFACGVIETGGSLSGEVIYPVSFSVAVMVGGTYYRATPNTFSITGYDNTKFTWTRQSNQYSIRWVAVGK